VTLWGEYMEKESKTRELVYVVIGFAFMIAIVAYSTLQGPQGFFAFLSGLGLIFVMLAIALGAGFYYEKRRAKKE